MRILFKKKVSIDCNSLLIIIRLSFITAFVSHYCQLIAVLFFIPINHSRTKRLFRTCPLDQSDGFFVKWEAQRRHFLGREYHNFSDTTMFLLSLLPSTLFSLLSCLSARMQARAANNILSDSHISPVSRLHVFCVRRRRWFSFVMLPATCFNTVKLFSALFRATTTTTMWFLWIWKTVRKYFHFFS